MGLGCGTWPAVVGGGAAPPPTSTRASDTASFFAEEPAGRRTPQDPNAGDDELAKHAADRGYQKSKRHRAKQDQNQVQLHW
jgi:hypothetical protein